MKKIQIVLLLFSPLLLLADTHYVDINSTNPTPPFISWLTAATNIQEAVNISDVGDTVLVTNGFYNTGTTITPGYSCLNRVVITNDITVKSVNGSEVTYIVGAEATSGGNGSDAVRCVYMNTGILLGFTITNGHTQSSGNFYNSCGGGVNIYGGAAVISNCILTGNSALYGGGNYYGALYNCTLTGNLALSDGGGSCHSELNNCILIGNSAFSRGGGSYYGTLNNCTLTGNSANGAGGSFNGTMNNCIISRNSAKQSGGGIIYGTLNNCMLTGNSAGNDGGGSYFGTLNNCTISGNSAYSGGGCLGSTLNNCIIYHNKALINKNYSSCTLNYCCTTPMPTGIGNITNVPMLISDFRIHELSPCVRAGSSSYKTGLDIDGENWSDPPSIGCDEPQHSLFGSLDVSMNINDTYAVVGKELFFIANIIGELTSNKWSFGDSSSCENTAYISHVWTNTGLFSVILTAYNDDNPSGVSATTIVTVIENNYYYVDKNNSSPISPYSSWETAATNIQDAVDIANMTPGNIVIVTNGVYKSGATVNPGDSTLNRVVISNDITVKSVNGPECTIVVGSESAEGGNGPGAVRGVYMSAGFFSGFTITNGHTDISSGGGGVLMSGITAVISNCILTGNSTHNWGGGSLRGTLYNCILKGNSAYGGAGGSSGGILYNCILTGNSGELGGGSAGAILYNCILMGNSAKFGGGCWGGTFYNCTMIGNSAETDVGGAPFGDFYNSILYYNTSNNRDNYSSSGLFSFCCTFPSIGVGCVTNNPQFVDMTNMDFRLKPTSPCIDAGLNADWMVGETDLSGIPRIMGGAVDIGAYELGFTANLKVILEGAYENE